MANDTGKISLSTAALIAGLAYVLMMATPFAGFYVFPKLVVPGKIAETVQNITANEALFRYGIAAYLVTFIGDVIAAWALYVLLKPVNESLSLLTAWFRLVYAFISLAALLHLVTILSLLNTPDCLILFKPDQLNSQVALFLNSFRSNWSLAYIFFGIHLILLGYLVFRSNYIPKIIGVLLIIAGIGWLINNLQPLLFPGFTINFTIIMIAGAGELVFMLWLLIKGPRIRELN